MNKKNSRPNLFARYQQQAEKRTYAALKKQDAEFAAAHAEDTDEALIAYVKDCARELGHVPDMCEVIGGKYIAWRFGGWSELIRMAGLPKPNMAPGAKRRQIFREEFQRQTSALEQERLLQREQRQKKKEERMEAHRKEKEERIRRDTAWGEANRAMTDSELLDYVRNRASELGYPPMANEVVGGEYILERFGGWAMVLTLAELPLPKSMTPPTKKKMAAYLGRRTAAEQAQQKTCETLRHHDGE